MTFTQEQRDGLRDALYEAQLAILEAIAREAARAESYDGPRNVNRLTGALQGLRSIALGLPETSPGWMGYPPFGPGIDDVEED